MAEVVALPKYGLLKNNEIDDKQIKEMKKRGYYIFHDGTTERIWMKRLNQRRGLTSEKGVKNK